MEPALRNGEVYLFHRGGQVRPGDVVLIRHPQRPELLTVKRVVRPEASGWWVEGDNPAASNDSREFGAVPASLVLGRVVMRIRPLRRD